MGQHGVLSAPGGPHMGPMNLAIKVSSTCYVIFPAMLLRLLQQPQQGRQVGLS